MVDHRGRMYGPSDPHRASSYRLSHLLLASHALLVLLLAGLLLLGALGTVRTAVLGQARVQAEQGIAEARARLRDWRRELGVAARLLAEQPQLPALWARGQQDRIGVLLQEFLQTSRINWVRLQQDGRVLVTQGRGPLPDTESLPARSQWWFADDGSPWRIEHAPLAERSGVSIFAAEPLGVRLRARAPLDFVEVALQPLDLGSGAESGADAPASAWQAALRSASLSGDPETLDGLDGEAVARIVSVRDESGQPVALLTARIAPDWVRQRLFDWLAGFGLVVGLALVLALSLAFWWSRRLARPFSRLADAAAVLGAGELERPLPLPPTPLAEAQALALQLDSMRQRVQSLTVSERSQRQQLDAVLDGVESGIASLDDDEVVRYANRQFLNLVAATPENCIGKRLQALLEPDHTGFAWPAGPGRERMRAIGGGPPLVLRRQPIASDGRRIVVLREQSAQEAAGALRDHVLANLSHEFQTPLAAQLASIELLREHLRHHPDEIATQLADAQYRGALRLSQLVDNLLDSLRIDSGEMRLRRQLLDLPQLIRDAVELLAPLIAQREQQVVLELPSGPLLSGDPPRLTSVVTNLLSNANKFAPDRSSITLKLSWAPAVVTLWVTDQGPGLPQWQEAQDLFTPFRRAPDDTEPLQRGSGLGLAIVAAHGGEICIGDPESAGVGARIGIRLPLSPSERA